MKLRLRACSFAASLRPTAAHACRGGGPAGTLMAEMKNYALNFGCGRALRALDFASAKSASAEIQRGPRIAAGVSHG